jgi:uncharacterized protein YkwD
MVLFAHNWALRCRVVARAWLNHWAARLHNARPWLHNWGRYVSVATVLGVTATIGVAPVAAGARVRVAARRAARGCADANTPAATASAQQMRAAVVCLIDRLRAAYHLPSLVPNSRLNRSAQAWTNAMVAHHEFTHGADFSSRISAVGFNFAAAGENIATGFTTPRAVVDAWMASVGHCQNILNPSYVDVGTGVNSHPVTRSVSGGATWTQDLGLPLGHGAPSHSFGPARGCPYR